MNDFFQGSFGLIEHDSRSVKASEASDGPTDPNLHVADYASQPGSTLLPMLIAGLVLIIASMIAVVYFF
jgi:hypothetical protein